jgi:hypothetical protein
MVVDQMRNCLQHVPHEGIESRPSESVKVSPRPSRVPHPVPLHEGAERPVGVERHDHEQRPVSSRLPAGFVGHKDSVRIPATQRWFSTVIPVKYWCQVLVGVLQHKSGDSLPLAAQLFQQRRVCVATRPSLLRHSSVTS